jgi:hypothetical protein
MDGNAVNAVTDEAPAGKKPKRRARPLGEMADGPPGEPPKGIICPKCHGKQMRVTRTMPLANEVRRYRKCQYCDHHWHTVER